MVKRQDAILGAKGLKTTYCKRTWTTHAYIYSVSALTFQEMHDVESNS